MNLVQYAAPTLRPVTLDEIKTHLRLDSETFAGNVTSYQSIAPGSHVTTTAYDLLGASVEVIGKQVVVLLESGTNGSTGTVDVKIQDSDDGIAWVDWTSGAFTQITTANDNATYEKAYTGFKRYIRVIAKVLLAACEFGVSILVNAATTAEDDDLNDLIDDGISAAETFTRRAFLTQTWDYYLDVFPLANNFIKIPFGNLQSITSFVYTDSNGIETELIEDEDFTVELNGDQRGRIVLPYDTVWPSVDLAPSNPIAIRFVCGWTTVDAVPRNIKRAIKFYAEDSYYHGDRHDVLKPLIENLLWNFRLWGTF